MNRAGTAGPGGQPAPVSVVVPCFRCTATIDDAVGSIVAQTWRPAEVVLVDDASGDDTLAHLHRIAAAHPAGWIRVIALPANGGPSRARNAGWQRAGQRYLAFLDADDTWAPRKLELQMAALEADPGLALLAHRMVVRPRGTMLAEPCVPVRIQPVGRWTLLLRNPFPTASVVLRRDLPFRFDEDFRLSEDYLLWSQIVFSGHRCAKLDQVLAVWNRREPGARGLSDDFVAIHRARGNLRRKLVRQGLLSRTGYMLASAVGIVALVRRYVMVRLRRRAAYRRKAEETARKAAEPMAKSR